MKSLSLLLLAFACLATSAQVLLPPIAMSARAEAGVLGSDRVDCSPSTGVVSAHIHNPTNVPFEGSVHLFAVTKDGADEVVKQVKLGPKGEERVAFDFWKGVCKNTIGFRLISKATRQ